MATREDTGLRGGAGRRVVVNPSERLQLVYVLGAKGRLKTQPREESNKGRKSWEGAGPARTGGCKDSEGKRDGAKAP